MVRRGYRLAHRLLRVYWFVSRPDVDGVKCVLTQDSRVLLVRHSYGPRTWELPGGGVKSSESAVAAARREMDEELGVTIDEWTSLGELRGTMQGRHDRLHCFQAEIGSRPLRFDPGEIVAGAWFPRDQLPEDVGRYVRPIVEVAR
jgi:8-oxo-dGTP pyrophosphatase MutT (NUDIX family)